MITDFNIEVDIPDEYIDMSLEELENMETIVIGQADDLKIDDGRFKVWLCRCGIEDGMPFNNAVTIEAVIDGKCFEILMYEAN